MSPEQVVAIARQTLEAAFWVAAPILISRDGRQSGDQYRAGDDLDSGSDGHDRAASGGGGRNRFLLTPWMLHHLVAFTINIFSDFRAFTH